MADQGRSWWSWAAYVALAALALGNAGCLVAAGVGAAGGVAGYAYYKGNVTRTYVANVEDVRAATRTALAELQMPLLKDEPSKRGARIESRAGDEPVILSLTLQDNPPPGQGPVTDVGVRVATFGDEGLSEHILDQIGLHLVPAQQVPAAPPPTAVPPQTAPPPLAK